MPGIPPHCGAAVTKSIGFPVLFASAKPSFNTPYQMNTVRENKTLSYVGCGSAPLPIELQSNFEEKFGKITNINAIYVKDKN